MDNMESQTDREICENANQIEQGQTNPAFQSSQLSIADIDEMSRSRSKESNRANWTNSKMSIDNGILTDVAVTAPKKTNSFSAPHVDVIYSWSNVNIWTGPSKSFWSWFKKGTKTDNVGVAVAGAGDTVINIKPGGKHLLKNVSGSVRSGELTCILGSSGAGKTTLLNTLTFQASSKLNFSGNRYLNGESVTPNLLASVSAYVQQQDLFVGTLTVREHLTFHALLRMHHNIPYERRMERVLEVIDEFGLSKCMDTIIGIPGRIKGLSGGEQKRLAFASEILTDPALMFCDEPTSGLDSFMAQTIVNCLKKQAIKGKGILCTIHQPSSALFQLFDRVLVMAEGRVGYFGPVATVLDFMKTQGFPCPLNYNPAEFLTQTLAIQPEHEAVCRENVASICDGFERSPEFEDLKRIIDENSRPQVLDDDNLAAIRLGGFEEETSHYKASWFAQFRAVYWRSWNSFVKDPFVLNLRILQNVALALIIGCVYFDQQHDQAGVQNINGAIFLFLAAITYQNSFGVVDVFCTELPVFLREHWNGMYRADVYFMAKIVSELPFYLLFPAVMVLISYYMIGLNDSVEALLYTILILVIITNVSTAFGYLLSCIATSVTMALILAPAMIFPFFLFGGFFMNAGSGPKFLKWIKYISWFFYGFESIAIVQWRDVTDIQCDTKAGACPAGGFMTGEMALRAMGFDHDDYKERLGLDIMYLSMILVAFQFIAFLALLSKTWRSN